MGVRFRICQFNVLAPSARISPPLNEVPWQDRHSAICDVLLRLDADVVCLQEFDFAPATVGFAALYEKRLGSLYSLHTKQRTGLKEEGVAVLLRKGCFEEVDVEAMDLHPAFCDRVALVARLRHAATGRRLLVANTHLTVAHAHNDHDIPMCRPTQMQQMLDALGTASPKDLVFMGADMNSDHLETEPPVSKKGGPTPYTAADVSKPVSMAFEAGLVSALHSVSPPDVRPISHTCSYAQDGCVDYVFFRPSPAVELTDAFLHPVQLEPDIPWSPTEGWGADHNATLSDHRPLVADFRLKPLLAGGAAEGG